MAVQQMPELLPVTGVDFVGPFPGELQLYTVFSAGVASASLQARRTSPKLSSTPWPRPPQRRLFKAKGLEPIPH